MVLAASDKLCVIFNPHAARKRAERRLQELHDTLGGRAEFWPTLQAGHGEDLARKAAESGFTVVAAAGGDGTVHEVANGILQAGNRGVSFAVLPLGSANDYAHSLQRAGVTLTRQVDVGRVRDDKGRERYFVNTLGLGFSGAVALESRRIRWLQGLLLYGLAFLRALARRYTCPVMEATFDDTSRSTPTLSLTLAIGTREGSLVVAPDALLDDGLFDYLQVGPLTRWEVLRYLPKLASGGRLPADHPAIWQGRCRAARLESQAPLTVHLDGEFFSLPEDDVRALEVSILPQALRVQSII